MISSMVALNNLQKRIDVISDNVANLNTVGYKSKDSTFEDTLTRVQNQADEMMLPGRSSSKGFNVGFGAKTTAPMLSFTQGVVKDTDLPTDLAIQGNALFKVETPNGVAWTREGDFQLHPDPQDPEQAYLTTSEGYYVLNTDGERVQIPANSTLQVGDKGQAAGVDADGNVVWDAGTLQLDYIQRPEGLAQLADNLYGIASGANQNDVLASVIEMDPADPRATGVSVKQKALEQSNVDLSKEMTDMIQIQRAYQLSARALTSSEAMMNMANHLRG